MTDLQDAVQGAQPPLSHSGGTENPGVARPTRLCVSGVPLRCRRPGGLLELPVFCLCWNPKELGSNTSDAIATGEMDSAARKRTSRQRAVSALMPFPLGPHQPARPRSRGGSFPLSNNLS